MPRPPNDASPSFSLTSDNIHPCDGTPLPAHLSLTPVYPIHRRIWLQVLSRTRIRDPGRRLLCEIQQEKSKFFYSYSYFSFFFFFFQLRFRAHRGRKSDQIYNDYLLNNYLLYFAYCVWIHNININVKKPYLSKIYYIFILIDIYSIRFGFTFTVKL